MSKSKSFGDKREHWRKGNIRRIPPRSLRTKQASYRFTWNNYKEKDMAELADTFLRMGATRFAFQEEIAPTTGTPHLQGCVFFKNERSYNVMKRINKSLIWFVCDLPYYAIVYSTKQETKKPDGKVWTHGINLEDFIEKPKIPLLEYKELFADMKRQMKEDEELKLIKWKYERKRKEYEKRME